MDTIPSCCARLAELLRESSEYKAFEQAKAAVSGNAALKALLDEYRRLQLRAEASELCGGSNEEELSRLQSLGEYLMMDNKASEYLFAQYKLSKLLSEVYKQLARSVDADLSVIDE